MMALRRWLGLATFRSFRRNEDGSVLAEALLAIPFVTLFAVGILEFGNIFWQRLQIENGLRDAARYMTRCRPSSATYTAACSPDIAKSLAFYGTVDSSGPPRVPGWGPDASDITIAGPDANGTITLSTSHTYVSSPLFGWLGVDAVKINSYQQEKYNGW